MKTPQVNVAGLLLLIGLAAAPPGGWCLLQNESTSSSSIQVIRPNNVTVGELKFENEFSYKRVSKILKEFLNLTDETLVQYSRVESERTLINGELLSMKMHPFIGSIHLAYSYHLPLVLTPDVIWHLIISGTSVYVNANAEAMRKVFVDFEGKQTIAIRHDEFVYNSSENKWDTIVDEFSSKLNNLVKWDVLGLMSANFSTTSRESSLASKIVLMESMQKYLEYEFYSLCGVPEFRLMGVRSDWASIQTRIRKLNATITGLSVWYNQLDSIIQNFISVYDGKTNNTFWDQIYKSKN
jgi:hypothetical protein